MSFKNKDEDSPLIELQRVSRSFIEGTKSHTVIDGISFAIAGGEFVALRGRSGSGKSTLLNIISGIDAPDGGTVIIDDNDVGAMSENNRTLFRRRNIGFVYQAFNLVSTLTTKDNVKLVLELNGMQDKEALERTMHLLDAVGLADRSESFPDVLSGGEQQRVAIARALAHEPMLILADEPTGNLDGQTATTILKLLDDLVRENGQTMIVATHSDTVTAICDRTLLLRDGVIQT